MKTGAAEFTVAVLGQPIPQPQRWDKNPSEPWLEVNGFGVALQAPDKLLSVPAAKRGFCKQGVNWVISTVCDAVFPVPQVPGISGLQWGWARP